MINVNPGETVNDVSLQDDIMNVFSTGVANGTIVDKDGWVYVSKGGILNNTFINKDGEVDLLSSGSANATQIMTDGILNVGEKAVAIGTIVEGGSLVVEEKGIASDTTVSATGQMYVFSGGKIKGTTTVNEGGFLTLEWESIHSSAIIHGGKLTVLGGPADGDMAFLQNFTVDSGGSLTVSGSALVSSGTIADGWAKVTSNGILEKVTLNAATVEIKNGALLSNADMKTGTVVDIASGGVIRKLAVSKGAVLTGVLRDVSELHFDGGTLDLNISGIAPGGEFLIGDTAYSAYISDSSYECTLTVDSSAQPTGVYNLIEDATGFDKTITVKDTLGTTLGTLTVGGDPLVYGPLSYKLSIDTTGLFVTVDAGGGGTPVDLTGDLTTTFELNAGMVGSSVNILDGGILDVMNDGFTSQTTIQSNGDLFVSAGGSADVVTVNFGGDLFVRNGGIATLVKENGGYASVNDGATVTFVPNSFNGYVYDKTDDWATLHSGTTGTDLTVGNAARILVFSSGLAKNTTVNAAGALVVSSGGKADGMNLKGGTLIVSDGGKATGKMTFETGATVTAGAGATLDFDLTQTTPGADALVNDLSFAISQPNFAYTLTVDGTEAAGDYKLAEGATGFDKTITVKDTLGTTLGTLTVAGGKTTIDGHDYTLTLNGTGSLGVTVAGGATPDITGDLSTPFNLNAGMVGSSVNILEGGKLNVLNGGFASQTTVKTGGSMTVSAGGSADIVTVNDGGTMFVYSGAKISNITDETNGQLIINGGVTATGIVAVNGAKLTLSVAPDTYVQGTYDGNAFELKDAVLSGFTLKTSGAVSVLDGGVTSDVTVSGGLIRVYSGGVAKDTLVSAGGQLILRKEGAVANGVTIKDGGKLTFSEAGGKLTGKVTIETGAIISVCDGAIVDFDISLLAPSNVMLVNNLSVISGTPSYTLTIEGTEVDGTYNLAGGVAGFDQTITVKNLLGTELGTLTVGATTDIVGVKYTLTLTGSNLSVTVGDTIVIDTTPPTVTNITPSTTEPAASVTITADFADETALAYSLCKIGDGTWQDYPTGGVTVTENTTVYFKAIDAAGNVSEEKNYVVTNIIGGGVDLTGDLSSAFDLTAGMVGSSVNILDGGILDVMNDGFTSQTTIQSNGDLFVSAGGSADVVTVNFGGDLYVSNGATATLVKENGGYASVNDGATVTFVPNSFGGYSYEGGDWCTIHSGTTGTDLTVGNDGGILVYSGGTAVDTTVAAYGYFYVYGGRITGKMTFETGATVTAYDGATFDFDLTSTAPGADALVNDLSFALSQPNFAYTLTVDGTEADGDYKLAEGATGFDKTITVKDTLGTTLGTLTVAGGKTTIDGRDYTLTLSTGGSLGLTLGGGGVTPDLTGDLDYATNLTTGMYASSVNILNGGNLNILNGGLASQTTVNSGGYLAVEEGGSANVVMVSSGGQLFVYKGGSATDIHWTPCEGDVAVFDGGYATFASSYTGVYYGEDGKLLSNAAVMDGKSLDYTRRMLVMNNGTATNTNVTNYGTLDVRSGGTAIDTTVVNGFVHVSSGGIAISTTVGDNSFLIISSGGVASDVTVNAGGKLNVSAGGKVTGKMTFETGAVVSAYSKGAILDFDLTQTTPGAAALVNDLSFALSQPFSYTITVDGTEADGDYKLAEGATGFDKTITVVNTSGVELGTLTVAGGKTTIDGKDYTLTLNGTGSLGVTVAAGGATPDITGDLSTSFELNAGMVGSSVNILDGGELNVYTGGFTSQTTVNSGGDLNVDGGGSADVVTVNFGGLLGVWFGGKATLVKENGGYVFVTDGATVTFVPNSFGGYVYDSPDEWATIHSGTTGTDLTVGNDGGILVDSGGTAVDTTVAADGIFNVSSGGTAVNTTVAADGLFYVSSGGTATGIVAEAGAYLMLTAASGTYAQGTYAGSAFEIVENATDFTVHDKVALYVLSDGTAADTTVAAGGVFRVHSGGTAVDTTVAADGIFNVSSGGTATGIVAVDGAMLELTVAPGTYQKGTYAGSAFEVADTVTDFTVHSGCELHVDGGGTADVVTVNFGGDLYVYNGATATLVKENGGYVYIDDGATVTFVPHEFTGLKLDDWASATIHSGTTGTNLTAANGGRIYVYSGGIADATTVNKEGYLYVYKGGTARDTTIRNLGNLHVRQNAAADGVTVEAGGKLWVSAGGKLTGKVTIETGADVTVYDGAIVDFDLRKTTTADPALVNDLSFFGTAAVNYTLTVDGSQASGTYNLADGATGFDKTITVMSPLGDEYGTLTVGGSLSTAFADYTLNLSGAALTLDLVAKVVVDTTPPVVSNVAADITAPTNGNVTVTADFTDNVAVAYRWFRLDAGAWQDYPTGGVVVDCNTVIDFMAIDTSGNESDVVTCTVTNIDKEPPTITAITPSTTELATSVTVTANFADDVALAFQQFKIGDGAWQDYTTGVTVTENGTIYFKAIDAAGNETTDSYEVTNIQTLEPDTTKPTVINVAADITAQTNGNVTVTAEFTDNVAVQYKYYTLSLYDMWQDYPDAGVTVTENGTVYFEAVDTSGNVSEIVTFSVTNIDKEAPTITGITPSTTAPAASVTVTATFSDNVALAAQQYKIGGGAWQNYVDGVLVTENALVTFKAVDTAGNETTETYDVTNISSGGGTVVTGDVTGETKDINTGMVASDVNVNVNGVLNIFAGGVASKTTVNTEGSLVVSGGSAVQTSVNAGGEIFVSAGGKADNTTVTGGVMRVYDGGSATNTTLQDNGSIIIFNGGSAGNTTAKADGWIRVSAGGVAEDVTVKNGGKLLINDGGKVTGKMTFETGALVSAYDGAILDFNIYSLSPANEALVNDLSIVQGTPKYTLTINGAQMLGTYNLAGGAAAFDQTITVQSILGAEVGTLTVGGGATKIGDVFYTLNLTGSDLTVTVASGGEADTTPPVVTNVMASITTPTNGDVTVTASFYDNVAVASSLYRINSGDWQNYTGGVTLTENATVSFKAVDTSGNESDVVSITVNNIDKTAPEKPTASANVTAPTNGSVNVTAIFAEDSVQNEYSMDGVNWAPYPGLVKFDNNGTVYFRSTDEVGNISEIESYAVTNIDKVPPAKPTASADITTTTSGNVTVTAVFSGDSAKKEFSLDGLVWQDYAAPLVFSANGKAYFRGTDAAGNQSDIISYSVTNIQPATPDNAPDDSKNDWVYNKKTKEWNSDANIASFVVNNITAGDSEVRLDKVGSVEKDGKHNFVGRSGSDEDAADYAKIELSKGAALSFSVDSTIAGTFVVLQATKDKKGNLVTTQRQKISVKAGQTSPKKTTTIYLEAGEYFVGMEAKLPSAKKGDAAAYYNVNLAGTTFFNDADTGWNNTAYKLDGDGKEVKTDLNPELVSGAMLFGRGATAITLDTGATSKDGYANWVGFSDATDYRMLTLEKAANVTLSLTATGKAKLSIWQVSTNAKGVIVLRSKGSTTAKADKAGTIKAKFLEAGTYFVSVESTDAKKGGSAYYNVSVDSTSVFFDSADTGKNNELYDKKAKAFYPEDKDHHFVTTNVSGAGTSVQLDSDPVKADGYKNFVGYQDKTDYAKINLTTDGNLFFKLKTTGDATFTVYRKGQDKKGNDTLETIQTTKLKLAKGASVIDKFTDVLSGLTAGEYYISMSATNTSTNAKGSVFYNVTATLEPSDAASLAMPETSDSLGISDALSFGGYDADALASASTSALADLDDKSAWQNISMLA